MTITERTGGKTCCAALKILLEVFFASINNQRFSLNRHVERPYKFSSKLSTTLPWFQQKFQLEHDLLYLPGNRFYFKKSLQLVLNCYMGTDRKICHNSQAHFTASGSKIAVYGRSGRIVVRR
jgi:hypothetical protein